jgi:hypothetical protein
MGSMSGFLSQNPLFGCLMTGINIVISMILMKQINIYTNRLFREATGGRRRSNPILKKCITVAGNLAGSWERRGFSKDVYTKAASKVKKCGYTGRHAVIYYIMLKYVAPLILFIPVSAACFPDVLKPAALSMLFPVAVEIVTAGNKRKVDRMYQKNTYKIYKYLHNQVSAGIKVTDAIRTVYEVVGDNVLKEALILLVAEFELTNDIDAALDEFRMRFNTPDSETLCIALKQGILTGDNSELLARQEDLMFRRYFNYIQAETDSCKTKNTLVAALFSLIVVIMITVPLLKDAGDAAGSIFMK